MADWPKYKSHKIVEAVKIAAIQYVAGEVSGTIHPESSSIAAFPVDYAYLEKHDPQVGGYIVRYEDGYLSWSPAKAFEEGYTRLDKVGGLQPGDAFTTLEEYDAAVKVTEPHQAIAVTPDLVDEIVARDLRRAFGPTTGSTSEPMPLPGTAGFVSPHPQPRFPHTLSDEQQLRREYFENIMANDAVMDVACKMAAQYTDFVLHGTIPDEPDA